MSAISSAIRSAMRPAMLSPFEMVGGGIFAQALAILRSFGADAHLYLPGIGYVNGVDAGNWLDTAFAATAVDSPVGLVMDAANTARGPEIVTDPVFDTPAAWTGSTIGSGTWSVSGGVGTVNSPDGSYTELMSTGLPPSAVGRAYEVVYEVVSTTGLGVRVDFGGVVGANRTVPGLYREMRVSTNTTTRPVIVRGGGAACSGAITSFSIREITGSIPVINTTTAQKPILRRDANGRYSWQFDGTDDRLNLAAVPFQMSDDFCAGFACTPGNDGSVRMLYGQGAPSGSASLPRLFFDSNGIARLFYYDGTSTNWTLSAGGTSKANTPIVVGMRRLGAEVQITEDGIVKAGRPSSENTSATRAMLGANGRDLVGEFFKGEYAGAYIIKGAVSDADRLTLDRMLAAFQGRTI